MSGGKTARGVGIGWRRELAGSLVAQPSSVDFVEVVAESCRDERVRREVIAASEVWPVALHGVKLSLGSAKGFEEALAREFGRVARELRAPIVSEHVAFTRAGEREIGHLTELPMTREAVRVVARNVAALRRHLPDVPLLLENVARGFLWAESDHEMSDGDFYTEVVRATGCELLLDAANLFANARNAGRDPARHLASYPLEHVAMVHVAGGIEEDGFYFDTHAHPVPAAVFDLVERVLRVRPSAAVLLERDGSFDDVRSIFDEVASLQCLVLAASKEARAGGHRASVESSKSTKPSAATDVLFERQVGLATALTACPFEHESNAAIRRARRVLDRKRAAEALPLLPRLGKQIGVDDALAFGRIEDVARLPRSAAIADAIRIAEGARLAPEFAHAATLDLLSLRARFAAASTSPRPRSLPWIGREAIGGQVTWAVKGFGTRARVRMLERGVQ